MNVKNYWLIITNIALHVMIPTLGPGSLTTVFSLMAMSGLAALAHFVMSEKFFEDSVAPC